MARSARQRVMPKTPHHQPHAGSGVPTEGDPSDESPSVGNNATTPGDRIVAARPAPAPPREERAYLRTGTKCVAGHDRGQEFDSGRLGVLPTRKAGMAGFALVIWCTVGLGLILDAGLTFVVIQFILLWLLFSAVVQRRMGHRGKCWRTRAWRHAWGGFLPRSSTPSRSA